MPDRPLDDRGDGPCPLTGHIDVATFGTLAAAQAGTPHRDSGHGVRSSPRCLPEAPAGLRVSARAGHGRQPPRGRPHPVLQAEFLVR